MSTQAVGASPLDALDAICRLDVPLDPELRYLLARLARRYPNIRPSIVRLAEETGASPATVKRRLRRLTDLGLITTIRTGRRDDSKAHRILHLPGLPIPANAASLLTAKKAQSGPQDGSPHSVSHEVQSEGQANVSNDIADSDELATVALAHLEGLGPVERAAIQSVIEHYKPDAPQVRIIARAVVRNFDPEDRRVIELRFAEAMRAAFNGGRVMW